jgi:subtilisin family serine protease
MIPTGAQERLVARRELDAIVARALPTVAELQKFLSTHGYENVLQAVPESAHHIYRDELLVALDRRGLLDKRFFDALAAACPAAEAPAIERAAGAFGVALHPMPATPERVLSVWLSPDQLDPLLEALRGQEADSIALFSVGSPWRSVLIEGGPGEHLDVLVRRLAMDQRPASRDALRWLLARLFENLEKDENTLTLFAQARDALGDADSVGLESSALPLPPESLVPLRDEMLPFSYLQAGITAGRAVGIVRFRQPKEEVGSTGWLLTPSLVVVPAHLFMFTDPEAPLPSDLQALRAKFEPGSFELDFDHPGAQSRRVDIGPLELIDLTLDVALVRLTEPLTDREPLRLALEPVVPGYAPIAMIHHPEFRPKQISIEGGRVIAHDGHLVRYVIATDWGSAGAPVLDKRWRVIATHSAHRPFRQRANEPAIISKTGTSTRALMKRLREEKESRLWREVVAAQPGFRTIDQTIRQQLLDRERESGQPATASFVIDLLDDDTSLDTVPDLVVGSRTGTLVTADGTLRSLEALENLPNVISVQASLRGGGLECVTSIPHIGALDVHGPKIATRRAERGADCLIAVIDTGIDVLHETFRDEHNRSRIIAFWDQRDTSAAASGGAAGNPTRRAQAFSPAGEAAVTELKLSYGALYLQEDLQRFIDGEPLPAAFPALSRMRHGTTVSSIAAGRRTGDDPEREFCGGVAPEAGLIVVRYDLIDATIGYNVGHIHALDFIDHLAAKAGKPVVVNISNGMNTGAHDGTSAVEEMCEKFLGNGGRSGRVIVKSAGNERRQARHAVLDVGEGGTGKLRWKSTAIPRPEPAAGGLEEIIELWFDSSNDYRFRVKPPKSNPSPWVDGEFDQLAERLENFNRVRARLDRFHASGNGTFRLEILPGDASSVEAGEWLLEIEGKSVPIEKPIHAWVERLPNRDVRFIDHVNDAVTVTVPGTTGNVIVVGAIGVAETMQLHDDSSFGPTRGGAVVEKPDIVAPGVRIRAAKAGTRRDIDPVLAEGAEGNSGTSFAAPHVTGAIALLLSARAKDDAADQFNARQIRQALLRSARHFNGRWKPGTGYGEVNVDSLFKMLLES